MVKPMLASTEPEREVEARLQTVGARRAHGGQPFGEQHQRGDDDADHRGGRTDLRDARLDRRRKPFGQPDYSKQREHQQGGARQRGPDAGRRGVLVFVAPAGREKIIAVAHRLDEDEGAVKTQ